MRVRGVEDDGGILVNEIVDTDGGCRKRKSSHFVNKGRVNLL